MRDLLVAAVLVVLALAAVLMIATLFFPPEPVLLPTEEPAATFMPDYEFEAAPPKTAKLMGPEEWLALTASQQEKKP